MTKRRFYVEAGDFEELTRADWIELLSDGSLRFLGYAADEINEKRCDLLEIMEQYGKNIWFWGFVRHMKDKYGD